MSKRYVKHNKEIPIWKEFKKIQYYKSDFEYLICFNTKVEKIFHGTFFHNFFKLRYPIENEF